MFLRCPILVLILIPLAFADQSTYVTPSDQQCPPNEVYKSCGTACEPSCAVPKFPSCDESCVDGCQCAPGYYRNTFDKCVLLTDCEYTATCKDIKCSWGKCSQKAAYPIPISVCDNGSPITCKNVTCKTGYRCQQIRVNCLVGECAPPTPLCMPNKT